MDQLDALFTGANLIIHKLYRTVKKEKNVQKNTITKQVKGET